MQHRRVQGLLLNLLVPGVEDRLQAIPHLHQPAGSDLHLQVEVEDLHDLRERVAQPVVQPGRQHQHMVAQRRAGQSVGNRLARLASGTWGTSRDGSYARSLPAECPECLRYSGCGFRCSVADDHHNPGSDWPDASCDGRCGRAVFAASPDVPAWLLGAVCGVCRAASGMAASCPKAWKASRATGRPPAACCSASRLVRSNRAKTTASGPCE